MCIYMCVRVRLSVHARAPVCIHVQYTCMSMYVKLKEISAEL